MNILSPIVTITAVILLSSAAFAEQEAQTEKAPVGKASFTFISMPSVAIAEQEAQTERIPVEATSFLKSSLEADAQAIPPEENVTGCAKAACGCVQPSCNYCCCLPRFYGQAEAVFLHRDNRAVDRQVVLNTGKPVGSNTLVMTRDFDFDFEPGIRLLLGYQINECCALEFSYLGGLNWGSRIHVSGSDNLAIPGDLGLSSNDFYNADEMQVDYSSNLNSFELNCVKTCCCCCCCVPQSSCADETCGPAGCDSGCGSRHAKSRSIRSLSIFTGLRYLALDEIFNIHSTDFDEGTSDYNIRTENDLFGWQIGATVRRCRGRVGWDLTGKAGIYGNSAKQSQYVTDFPPPFLLRTHRSTRAGNVAFVGELGISAWYQLTQHLSIRGGYNLFWIEGVALAPDQLDFTNTPTSGTALYAGNGLFLHGLSIGVEAYF